MRGTLIRLAGSLPLVALLAGCENDGSDLGFGTAPTGAVAALVFLDRDGSTTATAPDTVFKGASVVLRTLGGGASVATEATGDDGIAIFEEVPVGDYIMSVTQSSIGDSVFVADIDIDTVRVAAGAQTGVAVSVRLAFQEVSVSQARLLPAGRRVFLRGTVLSGIQSFADQSMHIADTSRAVRLLGVSLVGGLTGNNPGDSVVVLATVASANGQPVLNPSRVTRVATRPAPVPSSVTTGVAATANNGLLDGGLVQVTAALISDSSTAAPDFRVTASDGSGSLVVLLDGNLNFPTTAFRPGRSMTVRGVLVPTGQGTWVLKPRTLGDVTFLN